MKIAKAFLALFLLFGVAFLVPNEVEAQQVSQLTGNVTNAGEQPLADISVSLYRIGHSGAYAHTTTDGNGDFAFVGLPAGTYSVGYTDNQGDYAFEYFDDAISLAEATPIELDGEDSAEADAVLGVAGRIQGSLVGPDGIPPLNGYVFVFPAGLVRGNPLSLSGLIGGQYDIGGLNSGDYVIQFSGSVGSQYLNEYYEDAYEWSAATNVSVTAGFTTPDINGVIGEDQSGVLKGKVVDGHGDPIDNIEINLLRWRDSGWVQTDFMDSGADGKFEFTNLQTAEYTLLFRDWSGDYAYQYYGNVAVQDEATAIPVSGDTVDVGAFTMPDAGRIQGAVTDPTGSPLPGSLAFVFADGEAEGQVLFLDNIDDGTYELAGLPTGEYVVKFAASQGNNHYIEYYDDEMLWDNATRIAVTQGSTTSGIDAVLGFAPGGQISGEVTDLYGREFVQATVEAYSWENGDWQLVRSTVASYFDGSYLLDLPPGDYRLKFSATTNETPNNPIVEYYDDVATIEEAIDLTVELDGAIRHIDARLGNLETGSLSGTILDENGQPIPDISVMLYDSQNAPLYDQTAVSDENGVYTIEGLWPAEYYVEYFDYGFQYQSEFYEDATSLLTATPVPVIDEAVVGVDATLTLALPGQQRGALRGTLVGEDGEPVGNIRVMVYNDEHTAVGFTISASDGSYAVRDLLPGEYRIEFQSRDGWHVNEWYDDQPDFDSATEITVLAGMSTDGIDAVLAEAGRIFGTVADPFGNPFSITVVTAFVFDGNSWVPAVQTGAISEREYELKGIPAGTYRIGFAGGSWSNPNQESEFYDDVQSIDQAVEFEIVGGDTITGIDAVLGSGPDGEISGTVLDEADQPLAGIEVVLFDRDFYPAFRSATTDAQGNYTVDLLYSGFYYVFFDDPADNYPDEYYEDVASLTEATPIWVDGPVSGIDARLNGANSGPGGGIITGQVTADDGSPLQGIQVSCYDETGLYVGLCDTTTEADGSYTLGGYLPAGLYTVQFEDPAGAYVPEWFDDAPDVGSATTISLTLGNTVAGVDAMLESAGQISGRVTRPDGSLYRFLSVGAFLWNGSAWELAGSTTVFESGDYVLGGLPAGTYRVRFAGYSYNLVQTVGYYDGALTIDDADDVIVVAGEETTGIGGILGEVEPGTISGRVTDENGLPLADLAVQLLDEDGFMIRLAQTDANGDYEIADLYPGSYFVYVVDYLGFYLPEYFDDVLTLAEATPLIVTESEPVIAGVDVELTQVGGIQGSVLNSVGAPLTLAQVTALAFDGSEWAPVAATLADPAGNYQISNLPPGEYRIEFIGFEADGNGITIYTEYYDNAGTIDDADDVTVAAAVITTGIDAMLGDVSAATGQVEGQVNGESGALADIAVHLYWEDGQGQWWAIGHMMTDSSGQYQFEGLPDGRYHLCFEDPNGQHIFECFDDSTHLNQATAVGILDGATVNATAWLEESPGTYRIFLPITNAGG